MIRRYQSTAGVLTRIVDIVFVGLIWLFSYELRFHYLQFVYPVEIPSFSKYFSLLPLVIAIWLSGLHFLGVYKFEKVLRRSTEVITLTQAHLLLMLVFTSLTYFVTEYRFSRGVILVFGVGYLVVAVGFRIILRKVLRDLNKKGLLTTRVMLVGEGVQLGQIEAQIGRYPEMGLSVVQKVAPKDFGNLVEFAARLKPQLLIISIPQVANSDLNRAIDILKEETINIHLIPDFSEWLALGATVDEINGIPLIQINESPLFGFQVWLKRTMDFVLSLIGILFLLPFFVVIAVLIKVTSRGPVFYAQERVGLDGRTFKMLKFRSMKVDAEKNTGAVWAKENDDRRTAFGVFLRSTSIDELPQLWNVLVGDMSLVGPRPERPVFVDQFKNKIPHYMLRHKVKAGITGWAQVNGWRGDTSLEKRIECDLFYIRNWSLGLDIKILFLTVLRGFIHKNAY